MEPAQDLASSTMEADQQAAEFAAALLQIQNEDAYTRCRLHVHVHSDWAVTTAFGNMHGGNNRLWEYVFTRHMRMHAAYSNDSQEKLEATQSTEAAESSQVAMPVDASIEQREASI